LLVAEGLQPLVGLLTFAGVAALDRNGRSLPLATLATLQLILNLATCIAQARFTGVALF
jgi:hypothetical protein